MIDKPFHFDYEKNIFLGGGVIINMNRTLVDNAPIRVGNQGTDGISNVHWCEFASSRATEAPCGRGGKKVRETFSRTCSPSCMDKWRQHSTAGRNNRKRLRHCESCG